METSENSLARGRSAGPVFEDRLSNFNTRRGVVKGSIRFRNFVEAHLLLVTTEKLNEYGLVGV